MHLPDLIPECRDIHDLLVFTDLDGTLLDHHTYSYTAACPALKILQESATPLILTSSKTRSEIQSLVNELEINYPFIVENGAGIVIPDNCFTSLELDLPSSNGTRLKTFGPPLYTLLNTLHRLRDAVGVRFTGFSEMNNDEVMQRTGLSREAASLARKRDFSEPITWQDDESAWQAFASRLSEAGLYTLRGGRFIHIMSAGDKGAALAWLRDRYVEQRGRAVCTVALGDSDNDLAMLARADIPVVVRSPAHEPPAAALELDYPLTELTGPAGWNQAMLAITAAMTITKG